MFENIIMLARHVNHVSSSNGFYGGMGGLGAYGFFDPTMLLIIPAMILAIFAQAKVSSTFNKYSSLIARQGYTGADVARQLLLSAGITDVTVERIAGNLTDHYDPKNKVLRLSDSVFGSKSVAALGVAAHETGHAIQHRESYFPLAFRTAIFPVVNIGSKLSMPLILIGLLFGYFSSSNIILLIGIIMFALVVFFQIITLPVEFNASSRALKLLGEYNYLSPDEIKPAKKVLSAAALTYVAAAAVSIAQILRLLLIFNRRSD